MQGAFESSVLPSSVIFYKMTVLDLIVIIGDEVNVGVMVTVPVPTKVTCNASITMLLS